MQGYLRWRRTILINICSALGAEQLAARPPTSPKLSLLGLIRHIAKGMSVVRALVRNSGTNRVVVPPVTVGTGVRRARKGGDADDDAGDPRCCPDHVVEGEDAAAHRVGHGRLQRGRVGEVAGAGADAVADEGCECIAEAVHGGEDEVDDPMKQLGAEASTNADGTDQDSELGSASSPAVDLNVYIRRGWSAG